jgi:hypothetical protein
MKGYGRFGGFLESAVRHAEHSHKHRSEDPVLLAVDQELGEGAALWVAPELADPVGPVEVGEHQNVEQLGAGSGTELVEACSQPALKLVGPHGLRLCRRTVARVSTCLSIYVHEHWRTTVS